MIAAGRIFIIGDSHIGLADGAETRINAWLDRLAALRPKALYLNGDLFHYLIAHKNFRTSSITKVLEKMRSLRDAGISVHFVEGNRDFFLQGSFVEKAVSDVSLEYTIEAGAHRYLVVHGDLINDADWPYRFWRRLSKNPLSRFMLNFIPAPLARRFVDSVEKRLARSNFKHKKRLPVELIEAYGRRRADRGYTHVVLGHFHQKIAVPAGNATVHVLPPWYETGEAMVIDPDTGEMTFEEV